MKEPLADLFVSASVRRLRQFLDRVSVCVERMDDRQIWARSGNGANSVGNLLLHLSGNIRQWIVSGVGGAPDTRVRDEEFSAEGGIAGEELLRRLRQTVEEACATIEKLTPEQLIERRTIQGYDVSVLEAVYHVVEHFAQHAAQIFFAAKILTGEDLGFYRHLDSRGHGKITP